VNGIAATEEEVTITRIQTFVTATGTQASLTILRVTRLGFLSAIGFL
jgi:hypothetical protein